MSTVWVLAACGLALGSALADNIPGDARRGEELFRSQQCIQCHSINGHGGTAAPDLGRRIDRNYTPTVMATLMWNHAPRMWAAMKKQNIAKAELSPESAADLFAYFVSARYFEQPGDAGAGETAICRQALRRVSRHREIAESGSAAGRQVGLAGRSDRSGAADVEPRRAHERRAGEAENSASDPHRPGTHRYAGVPAAPAGNEE